jgi:hypothetical protein
MTNEQRTALIDRCDRMFELNAAVLKIGDRAQATGDLTDEDEAIYARIVFGMGRADEAALNALGMLGMLEGGPKLKIHMTDPAEIIARSDVLIETAEAFILDIRLKMGEAP